jgi:hypothetical protein
MPARLAPDMLDFSWQIKQLASHALDGLNGACAGRYTPNTSRPPTTLAALAERVIDGDAVTAFVSDAAVIIAHNAAFDRKFSERYWPSLRSILAFVR